MKLLICTQTLDKDDPFLGFFHAWVDALAQRVESVEVICLKAGPYSLPKNVRVHSLGKEGGRSRLKYIWRFYRFAWSLRRQYDAVFVHMNQEYVLLGGLFWRLSGKRLFLWRNHYAGSLLTDIAVGLCRGVFCTSAHSYTARFPKTKLMPVGVDTSIFRPDAARARTPHSILFLGRVTASKRPEVLVEALGILKRRGIPFSATLCGPVSHEDTAYIAALRARIIELNLGSAVALDDGIAHDETPAVFASHEVFVNLSRSGMYDKTLFEAAASGCLVVSASDDFNKLVDQRLAFDGTAEDLAATLEALLTLTLQRKERIIAGLADVAASNSLDTLAQRIVAAIEV